jgi:NADH-quinone oxidoreductase subunit F/NADP-reducing hydrogenase subunit HndC
MSLKEQAGHLLLNAHPGSDPATEEYLNRLRRDTVDKPVIYVGTGTCGLVAGSKGTLRAIRQYRTEKTLCPKSLSGFIGLSIHEPMVEIQLP